jgi:hypothetical protein
MTLASLARCLDSTPAAPEAAPGRSSLSRSTLPVEIRGSTLGRYASFAPLSRSDVGTSARHPAKPSWSIASGSPPSPPLSKGPDPYWVN